MAPSAGSLGFATDVGRVSDALVEDAEARPDVAEADAFHELLCRRADLLAQPRGPRGPEVA